MDRTFELGSQRPQLVHGLREIDPGNRKDVASIARLHHTLLHWGPMSRLGELFLRRFCYSVLIADGLMRAALYEVDGQPVGFVAYTGRSITFHREALRAHWGSVAWVITLSILRDPRLAFRVLKVSNVIFERRGELAREQDPLGEVVAIGVLPEYLSTDFIRRTGLRISEELVVHALAYCQRAGISKVRMIVDAHNKPALFLYHRLGARLEPCRYAGVPSVLVWFDLTPDRQVGGVPIPDCWDTDLPAAANGHGAFADGNAYGDGDGLVDYEGILRAESDEYVQKLEAALPLSADLRVLDFGCGFGFVAETLAPKVGELFLWDSSVRMRQRARLNAASRRNVRFLDLSNLDTLPGELRFDLILVNSVVQYMTAYEFSFWLPRWRDMLAPRGRLVISDVIPAGSNVASDLAALMVLAVRRRFLARALWEAGRGARRYWSTRSARPLRRVGSQALRRAAGAAGMTVRFLPASLTHRPGRLAVVLSPARRTTSRDEDR